MEDVIAVRPHQDGGSIGEPFDQFEAVLGPTAQRARELKYFFRMRLEVNREKLQWGQRKGSAPSRSGADALVSQSNLSRIGGPEDISDAEHRVRLCCLEGLY